MLNNIKNKTVENIEKYNNQITLYFTDGSKIQFYANIHDEIDYSFLQ